jgi:IS1 family transposase
MAGVSKVKILRLLEAIGPACVEYQDKAIRNVPCKRVQFDEIWQLCYAMDKNVLDEKRGTFGFGDVLTWVAIDPDATLVLSLTLGTRGAQTAKRFMDDLASRLANRVQLTTDGHRVYLQAVEDAFGKDIDYAMLIKLYGEDRHTEARYSPAECIGCREQAIMGRPNSQYISTSHVERQNLTMRMSMRRFTRLTNAFSKKVDNHSWAIARHYMHYNFCRIHQTLRVTPEMEAGISEHVWSIEEPVGLLDSESSRRAA